jgi:DNA-binding beta-propeller fold protein YncE
MLQSFVRYGGAGVYSDTLVPRPTFVKGENKMYSQRKNLGTKVICIMSACILLISSFCIAADHEKDMVWVLHNEDSDYTTPPFDDTLSLVNSSGKITTQWTGFNIAQTVGGHRAIAASPHDKTVVVCENVNDKISKHNIEADVLFTIDDTFRSVDVVANGIIYALAGGSIYGDRIIKISAEGDVLDSEYLGGFDLKADEISGGVYIVGGDLKYCNLDLASQWSTDPIGWCAVSVDTDANGTAWVVERKHSQIATSHDRLLHISSTGTILHSLDLAYAPSCVRVDKENGSVYVAGDQYVYKYNLEAVFQSAISLDGKFGFTLSIGSQGLWVGTFSDLRLISYDGTRTIINSDFLREDQKYVASFICPSADLTDDCAVDFRDVAVLASQWLQGPELHRSI